MHRLAAELYPICRSITGNGVRRTLSALQEIIPLNVHEIPTGTQVFDWTVPKKEFETFGMRFIKKFRRGTDRQLLEMQSACSRLQRAGPEKHEVRGIEATPLHSAGASRLDSLSHFLLSRDLGILSE